MIPAKPRPRLGSRPASPLQLGSIQSVGSRLNTKSATSLGVFPAASGNPNRAAPDANDMTAGLTPSSSQASTTPTSEASAPLPPLATMPRRVGLNGVRAVPGGQNGLGGGLSLASNGSLTTDLRRERKKPASSRIL